MRVYTQGRGEGIVSEVGSRVESSKDVRERGKEGRREAGRDRRNGAHAW